MKNLVYEKIRILKQDSGYKFHVVPTKTLHETYTQPHNTKNSFVLRYINIFIKTSKKTNLQNNIPAA